MHEYKEVFKSIRTPQKTYEDSRLNMLMHTLNSDEYDDIDLEARMLQVKRISKYNEIINSLYFQFIQKISTEITLEKYNFNLLKYS